MIVKQENKKILPVALSQNFFSETKFFSQKKVLTISSIFI